MSNDNGIADALQKRKKIKMSNKLTFRALMKKYGDGEINEETKIKFFSNSQFNRDYSHMSTLSTFMSSGYAGFKDFDFEIIEEKKKVFEYKCCNSNNFRAFKDCTILSFESFTFITNLTWEEFNDSVSQKAFLHETREIEI